MAGLIIVGYGIQFEAYGPSSRLGLQKDMVWLQFWDCSRIWYMAPILRFIWSVRNCPLCKYRASPVAVDRTTFGGVGDAYLDK